MTSDAPIVLCLPYAGAGANVFRPWQALAPAGLRLRPLQLPGREERTDAEPYRDVGEAVRGLLPEVVATLSGRAPVAVFGHSLGAVLAYELARAIEERTELPLVHVFVSGSPAPWRGRVPQVVTLDDDEFVERVEKLAGYRHAAFDSPEFRDLLLPTLRADVAMHEAYRPLSDEPIQAPLTCLRGETDELVAEAAARQWGGATSGGFTYRSVPGGHMYLTERPEVVVELMATALRVSVPGGDREAGARCG